MAEWRFEIEVLRHPLYPDQPVHLHRLYRDNVFAAASQIHEGLIPEMARELNQLAALQAIAVRAVGLVATATPRPELTRQWVRDAAELLADWDATGLPSPWRFPERPDST